MAVTLDAVSIPEAASIHYRIKLRIYPPPSSLCVFALEIDCKHFQIGC